MNSDDFKEAVRICSERGKPPLYLPPSMDEQKTLCACGYWKFKAEMPLRNSGVIVYTSDVCRGCERKHGKLCRLVCSVCRKVVAVMTPHKDNHGFEYVSGKTYHLDGCPDCLPEQESPSASVIIEKNKFLVDKFGKSYQPLNRYENKIIS
jgi:hypothetical protein